MTDEEVFCIIRMMKSPLIDNKDIPQWQKDEAMQRAVELLTAPDDK